MPRHFRALQLCDLPTPFESLEGPSEDYDVALSVKRDDLTNPVYGGNKVRKLEFLLGRALAEERTAVLTFGAYGSNHALATAVHARGAGLEPHVVLSPQAPTPYARATLLAHAGLGTVIHLAEGWDGARAAVEARAELRSSGTDPLVIPMGGTDATGVLGYVNAALESHAQREADVMYVAGGTLGTALGLALGLAAVGASTRVVAVRVTPAEVAHEQYARKITAETVAHLREADPSFPALTLDDLAFDFRHDWFEPGYGVVTPETLESVGAGGHAGLVLETTYTGKAYAAMLADARRGDLAGRRVLFWDTYNSAAMPAPGDVLALPAPLQDYVAECDRLFGTSAESPDEVVVTGGDTE